MTVKDYFNKVQNKIQEAANQIKAGELVAVKQVEGMMKQRVFNAGADSNNAPIGTYSPGYAKKRAREGRQTAYKDLQMTGHLFNSIKAGKNSTGRTTLGIVASMDKKAGVTASQKATYQEEQTGRVIFEPSENELSRAKKIMKEHIAKAMKLKW
jgi:hypothetical protein